MSPARHVLPVILCLLAPSAFSLEFRKELELYRMIQKAERQGLEGRDSLERQRWVQFKSDFEKKHWKRLGIPEPKPPPSYTPIKGKEAQDYERLANLVTQGVEISDLKLAWMRLYRTVSIGKGHGEPAWKLNRASQMARARFTPLLVKYQCEKLTELSPEQRKSVTGYLKLYREAFESPPPFDFPPECSNEAKAAARALVAKRAAEEEIRQRKEERASAMVELQEVLLSGSVAGHSVDRLLETASRSSQSEATRLMALLRPEQVDVFQVRRICQGVGGGACSQIQNLFDLRQSRAGTGSPGGYQGGGYQSGASSNRPGGLVGEVAAQSERLRRQAAEKEARRRQEEAWRSRKPYGSQ